MRERAWEWLGRWSGVLSTIIICLGICSQGWKVIQLGSSDQIAGWDLTMRTAASLLWLLQYHHRKIRQLIWCQRIFLTVYGSYVLIVIYFWHYPSS